ncbi:MAG: fibronectin type III domain-containing protein, partial [Cytophagales bacterium]|nr:fibronectin type III domain-containing protein [Cytophagales bacterium]
ASTNETGFQVERSTTAGSGFALITTTAANAVSFSNTGLTAGTQYFYRIRSINAGGTSAYTAEANATASLIAPTTLAAVAASPTQINLTWADASANETGFQIERSLTSSTGFTLLATTAANVVSFSNTGLTDGTKYFYRIRAINATGISAYTAEVNATTTQQAPTTLAAVAASATQINLTWVDASANETGFQIERSLTTATGFTLVTTTAANAVSFSNTGLTDGTKYFYRIRAINATGTSAYTAEVNATTTQQAPTTLTATPASTTQINLTWADVSSSETGYQIERSLTTATGFTLVATTAANATTFSNTGLTAGTRYFYRIRATNANGNSAYTAEANATASLIAPTILAAVTASTTQLNLTWVDGSSNETGFQIERSLTSGTGFTLLATTAANAVSYSNTGLAAGTKYYYRVRAVNATGISTYTNEGSATTSLMVPTSLLLTAVNTTQINLTWADGSINETGFQIERSLTTGTGFTLVTTTAANAISFSNTGLTAGTTYFYRLRAINADGTSAYTAESSMATIAAGGPIPPTTLVATTASTAQINLTWVDASTSETGFQIERSLTTATGFTLVGTTAANVVSFSNTGLTAGTRYFYRIRAINATSNSAYTAEANATTSLIAPTTLTAVAASATQINLTWADVSTNETGFQIERSLASATGFTVVGTTAANVVSFDNTGLTAGTQYFYRIRAINATGNSAYTAEANATASLIAPTTLAAVAASATQINLTWVDASANETGFQIERSLASATGFTVVGTTAADVVSFANTELTAGTQYFYRIRAVNATGNSAYTAEANATTSLVAPTALAAVAASATQINLTWVDASANETGFQIERSLASATGFTLVGTTAANVVSFANTGLTAGTQYFYRIRAINATGNSAYTAEVNAIAGLVAPTTLAAVAASATQINLTWADVSTNETGFQIERSLTTATGFTLVGTTAANVVSFANTGLTEGTQYFYRIRAVSASGNSAYTAEANATTSLVAPTALTAVAASPTQINLTWADVSTNETGFQVERSLTTSTGFTLVGTTAANAVSFVNTGLTAGTQYFYRIRAVNATGNSAYTAEANAIAGLVAPTTLAAVAASATQINLTWSDVSTNETGFQVERSTTSGTGFVLITTTAANAVSFSNTGLTANTRYFYRVRSVNAVGTSVPTAEASALTSAPAAPTMLTAVAASSTQINLTWVDASTSETGFQIERSLTSGSGFSLISTAAANATTFSNTGLTANTVYFYRVRAINGSITSGYAPQATASTSAPLPPTTLNASAFSSTQINLTWVDASNNETGFQVERSTTSGSGYTLVTTTAANATSFSNTALTANTSYFYRVRAVNAVGSSNNSSEFSTSTMAPIIPTTLAAVATSTTQINLTWVDASNNETGFQIERSTISGSGFTLINTTAANATTFSNTGLTAGTRYFYRIRSTNGVGSSLNTPEAVAVANLVAPTALAATAASQTQVNLTWTDASANETGFQIERSLIAGTGYAVVATTAANVTSFSSTGLTAGTQYFYRVRAINNSGTGLSAYTAVTSVTTLELGNVPDQVEFNALKDLFTSTNGANWANKTNWPTTWPATATSAQFGTWFGVTVANGDITGLHFQSNLLVGSLPVSLGSLPSLTTINLRHNTLTGTIPQSWQSLTNLKSLDLVGTAISTPIPAYLNSFTGLTSLLLQSNNFSGPMPELGALVELNFLWIEGNFEPGPIPNWVNNLNKIRHFVMQASNRTGILPNWLAQKSTLTGIYLSNNNFVGEIPSSIGSLPILSGIYLANNQLTGVLPSFTSPYLLELDFSNNQLSGQVNSSYGAMANLSVIKLGQNNFTSFPDLSQHPNRQNLSVDISNNKLGFESIKSTVGKFASFNYTPQQSISFSQEVSQAVNWVERTNVNITKASISRQGSATDSWDAGAFSSELIADNAEGYIEFAAGETETYKMIGLSTVERKRTYPYTSGFPNTNYSIYFQNSAALTVFEGGVFVGHPVIKYSIGDLFRIERKGSSILYKKNGVTFYTSLTPSSGKLFGDCSFYTASYSENGTINNVSHTKALGVTTSGLLISPTISPTATGTFVWEKQQTNGSWQNVNSLNQDATQKTFKRTTATVGDAGTYRLTITEGTIANLTLQSYPTVIRFEGAVPDAIEYRALKDLFTSTNGANWANKTNWPTTWPATATAAEMGSWFGVGIENQDITSLYFVGNNLNGLLPSSLGNLTSLKVLNMRANNVNGPIPSQWSTLVNLTDFEFSHTAVSGNLPTYFKNFPNLVWLSVISANLTGDIPDYSGLNNLRVFGLAGNFTPGPIPDWIGTLPSLAYFGMTYANRTGSIPAWVGNKQTLIGVSFDTNQLTGEIPTSIGNLAYLTGLNLNNNQLSGALPANFLNAANIQTLFVANNQLTGALPNNYFVGWNKLTSLNLAGNNFTSVPNLATNPNKANLTVAVENNLLDFSTLEPMVNKGLQAYTYAPQKNISDVSTITFGLTNLTIPARPLTVNSIIVWEKQLPNGTWLNINAQNQDATQKTFTKSNPTAADEGNYRWSMTNTLVTGMTLQSAPIQVNQLSSLTSAPVLYNGLITTARWRTDKAYGTTDSELSGMYLYDYDEKYQLKEAVFARQNSSANGYVLDGNNYRLSGMTYDPNGNIKTLKRYGDKGQLQHNFTYTYDLTKNNNQLKSVSGYANNYEYNKIGQMIAVDKTDANEKDQWVDYDVTGKVVAVYEDVGKTKPTVRYTYDDRGFRLTKVAYPPASQPSGEIKTTWYIRDASGNVLSIYEQTLDKEKNDASSLYTQTEVPIYGAGKLATYYPAHSIAADQSNTDAGSTAYEITDHLGNVRAIVRIHANEYTATMEDDGTATYTNPRVRENVYFKNLFETERRDLQMNHTSNAITAAPSRAANLHWISGHPDPNFAPDKKSVGPAIALSVSPGDQIDLSAWARFKIKASYTNAPIKAIIASALAGQYVFSNGLESITQAATALNSGVLAAVPSNQDDPNAPRAYINYVVFNSSYLVVNGGALQVPASAGFEEAQRNNPYTNANLTKFDSPITIAQPGYIYVWVSNESENTEVWFDDVSVIHHKPLVAQATDYEAWGGVLREQKWIDLDAKYRYGYQGKYAEKDDETGWNHFELREYDPVIGRWTSKDPAGQFYSPYVGMGNNPVSGVDPDGGKFFDFYKEIATGKVSWIDGSGKIDGFEHLSENKYDASVLNAIGADIMKGGWNTFIGYIENKDFGTDWFFKAAEAFPHNASGFMGDLVAKDPRLGNAISLSIMTHDWVAKGGSTERLNTLEHHMGMFLTAEAYGPGFAMSIGDANELRGLFINDWQSGNFWNALFNRPARGGGPTAHEWKDVIRNHEGLNKWRAYHGLPTTLH